MIQIIQSGSKGNAVLYGGSVLVDCGVSFTKIKPYLSSIKLLLLTHSHADHFKPSVIKQMLLERPSIRIGVPQYLAPSVEQVAHPANIDVLKVGYFYNYGAFKVSPIKLYHDVPNVGYRLFFTLGGATEPYRILHATDTAHLNGISAIGYNLYAIEHNYHQEVLNRAKLESQLKGQYTHAFGSEQTHLSVEQAQAFIAQNASSESKIVELHKSSSFYKNF